MTCSKWFDEDCIAGSAVDGPLSKLETSSATATKILTMPIERGALDIKAEGWRVSGNGDMVVKVLGWYRSSKFPNDWKAQLGRPFINYVQEFSFTYYKCPNCKTVI
jgi:hypothetical protein